MIDVIVTQRVHPGSEKEFEELVREVTLNTLANDEGCLRYEWYRSEIPQTYILIERWTDRAAAQAHLAAEHMARVMPKIERCVPERFSLNRLVLLE